MSYHHTCPGCAIDQARRRCDEPDRGTLCERCSESGALAYVIRLCWQADCHRLADDFDKQAAECALQTHVLARSDNAHAEAIALWTKRAERSRARAAQYREWAAGKESKPLYEVRTRPWVTSSGYTMHEAGAQ